MQGGTATLSCRGDQVSLDSVTPTPGFETEKDFQNGGITIEVRFRSDSHESQLDASCSGDIVQGKIQESSR